MLKADSGRSSACFSDRSSSCGGWSYVCTRHHDYHQRYCVFGINYHWCYRSGWRLITCTFYVTLHYTRGVKNVANPPPPETFCNIFTQAEYISMKFLQFVANLYPCIFVSSGRYASIIKLTLILFYKTSLLIVFTFSTFEFCQVKLSWLDHQWWVAFNSPDFNPLDYYIYVQCPSLVTSCNRSQKVFGFKDTLQRIWSALDY